MVKCSGSSQAAPHVTGIVALLIEAACRLPINLTDQKAFVLKNILRSDLTQNPETVNLIAA